ncbi:MAG: DUF5717 family protein [Lachnospiraceae bacterium]|nr:DUF5717 family protein [Lachnospiraceae bacterium]
MRSHIEKLINGTFEYESGHLVFSEKSIEMEFVEGEVPSGSFGILSSGDEELEGYIGTTSLRMKLGIDRFSGRETIVHYTFDPTGLESGDTIKGEINVVSNRGEYNLPFTATLVRTRIESSVGTIRNLFHFANLAHTDFDEASRIFYSEKMQECFVDSDQRFAGIYKALSVHPGNVDNVEQFLIAIHKKDPVTFVCLNEKFTLKNFSSSSDTEGSFEILKSGWGYVDIRVYSDSDFVRPEKERLGNTDFLGNRAVLKFSLDPECIHSGVNLAKITLESNYCRTECFVNVSTRVHNADLKRRNTQIKKAYYAAMNLFLRYRMHKINATQWMHQGLKLAEEALWTEETEIRFRLYRIQMLIAGGRKAEAESELGLISEQYREAGLSEELNAYLIYLKALLKRDNAYTSAGAEIVRRMYERRRDSDWLLIILIYTDADLERMPVRKLSLLEEHPGKAGSNPLILLEALEVMLKNPDALRTLGSFELRCVRFGIKNGLLNRAIIERVTYLGSQMREYSPLLHRILCGIYRVSPSDGLITSICSQLIRGGRTDLSAFGWYTLAIERGIKITRLYEHYMYSVPEGTGTLLPRGVLLYFGMGGELQDSYMAFFYANMLRHASEVRDLIVEYESNLFRFAISAAERGFIDENMSVVYSYTAKYERGEEKEKFFEALAPLMFIHHIRVELKEPSILIVVEEKFTHERQALFDGKDAYVPIYGGSYMLFIETRGGERYALEDKAVDRQLLKGQEFMEAFAYIKEEDGIGASYYRCAGGHHFIAVNENNAVSVRRLIDSEEIVPGYRSDLLMELMEFEYSMDHVEELDKLLERLDPGVLSGACRADMVRFMVIRGMISRAYEIILRYGAEKVGFKILARLLSHLISAGNGEREETLLTLAYITFRGGKYDEVMLQYLAEYFEGTLRQMRPIWKAAVNFGVVPVRLEERLLSQMLYSRTFVGEKDEIFLSYLKRGIDSDIVMAYLSYNAYEYMIHGAVTNPGNFEKIIELYYDGEKLNDYMLLSAVIFYSGEPSIPESAMSALIDISRGMIARGIVLEAFRRFKDEIPLMALLSPRVYVEYKTNPSSRVVIHFLLSGYDGAPGDYIIEDMKNLFGGIYSRRFNMFYGEELQYYITEELGGKSTLTASNSLVIEDQGRKHSDSKYGMINDMLICTSMMDDKSLMALVELYLKKNAAADGLFELE